MRGELATNHVAVRDATRSLTRDSILDAARITRDGLREWLGIGEPRIALCALIPRAGDGQRFGDEDVKLLGPAAREAKIAEPFPADTVFVRAMRGEFDA